MKSPLQGLAYLLLGQPDVSEQLMRALALKGALPQYLHSELEASLTVDDLTRPEYNFLRRGQLYQSGVNQAALAANFNYLVFGINTPGRALAVVERIVLANTAPATGTSFWVFMSSNNLIGVGSQAKARDDRQNRGVLSANRIGSFSTGVTQNAASIQAGEPAGSAILVNVPAASTVVLDIPFVLTGALDSATGNPALLVIQSSQVNVPSAFGITWRERAILATETL